MKELLKSLSSLELQLEKRYGVSLNEAMVLCCIGNGTITASMISEKTGMTPSNTSKVIRSIENKELITHVTGEKDRRQKRFTLTDKGLRRLDTLKNEEIDIPDFIKPLFEH